MLIRKAVQKTKIFIHKTLQNLKTYLFGGYQKLPNSHPLNQNMQQLDNFYKDFSELWDSDNEKMKRHKEALVSPPPAIWRKEPVEEGEELNSLITEEARQEKGEKKTEISCGGKRGGKQFPAIANGGGSGGSGGGGGDNVLAQKMKELEMMDVNDMEHVLDIEEVLHLYSRLKSPVYLDIVDEFFMDMYTEYFIQQPSSSIIDSSRRLGPLKF